MTERQRDFSNFSQQALANDQRRIMRLAGIVIIVLCVCGIVAVLLVTSNTFAEWKRSNPPEWARLAKNDKSYFEINTRLVIPQDFQQVVVVTREVPRDTEAGLKKKDELLHVTDRLTYPGEQPVPYADVSVEAYGCDPEHSIINASQYVPLSLFVADASGRRVTSAHAYGAQTFEARSPAAVTREAACWLRNRAKPGTRLPSGYRPSGYSPPFLNPNPYERCLEPQVRVRSLDANLGEGKSEGLPVRLLFPVPGADPGRETNPA